MASLEIIVYPRELDSAEVALTRLGWEVLERGGEAGSSYSVSFRIPCDGATLELVDHETARSLTETSGHDVIAGLALRVDDADAAWQAARAAGLRLDPVSEKGPSEETWGRLVRVWTSGGLRLDFVQRPASG
jgi:catechol 2,3-dioxygenase-like lactoylglutathione lyase family enzyme